MLENVNPISVNGLVSAYRATHPDGHFFDPSTLRFFGEKFSTMNVIGLTEVESYRGDKHICYVLSSLQANHPMGETYVKSYFDTKTFDHIIPKD